MTYRIIAYETDAIAPELIAMGFRSERHTEWYVDSDEIVGGTQGPFASEAKAEAWAKEFFGATLDHYGM